MVSDAKRRRSDDGEGRQARTRLARKAVVEAARALFLERGYAGTTIEAISDLSDVPAPTVYRLFSSKLGILKTLLDVSVAGDDEAVGLERAGSTSARFSRTETPGTSCRVWPARSAASCRGPSLYTGSS